MKYIVFVLLVMFVYMGVVFGFAKDVCIGSNCLGAKLYKNISTNLTPENDALTKKKVVENFCNTIYSFKRLPDNSINAFRPSESIFLQVLCMSVGIEKENSQEIELKPGALVFFKTLPARAKSEGGGECLKRGVNTDKDSMNNVDFTCVARKAFTEISSDMIDIGNDIVFGGFGDKEKGFKWEKDFFAGKDTPCEDSFFASDDEEKHYCRHPKTYKYMQDVNENLAKILVNLKIISINQTDIYEKFVATKGENNPGAPLLKLKDKTYQEFYFYSLFLTYYASTIKIYRSMLSLKTMGTEYANIDRLSLNDEVIQAKKFIVVSKVTLRESFKRLKNVYWSYPLHLGFLAILEDMHKLRMAWSKVYTPLELLRRKLTQAQDEDEGKS